MKQSTTFYELNLPYEIQRAIDEMGFVTATEIQAGSIPLIRQGKDVIGRSQTGTGKTLAFGIPAIEMVETGFRKNKVQVLVLCPTRELAMQACEEFRKLTKYKSGIGIAAVYGGAPMDRQISELKRASIVIGTPGRIMDHMRRRTLRLDGLKMIVLDEADEMLSMGFREDIETILEDTPEDRQTLLFSATMPPEIMQLTDTYQKDPDVVMVNPKQPTVENIQQYYYEVPRDRKLDALNLLLQYHNPKLVMIFANTKQMVDEITEYLNKNGYQADGLHGDMKQAQRTKVMNAFKRGHRSILIATDVAARGIDVNNVDYVINYDIPQNDEYYIHRIGRTGRAGKSGKAITLCCGRRQAELLRRTGRQVKAKIVRLDLPNSTEVRQQKHTANVEKIEKAIDAGNFSYKRIIIDLVEKGYSPQEIAAAALQLYFGEPVENSIIDIKFDRPRHIRRERSDQRKDYRALPKKEKSKERDKRKYQEKEKNRERHGEKDWNKQKKQEGRGFHRRGHGDQK